MGKSLRAKFAIAALRMYSAEIFLFVPENKEIKISHKPFEQVWLMYTSYFSVTYMMSVIWNGWCMW